MSKAKRKRKVGVGKRRPFGVAQAATAERGPGEMGKSPLKKEAVSVGSGKSAKVTGRV